MMGVSKDMMAVFLFVILFLQVTGEESKMSTATKNKINTGISNFKSVVDSLEKFASDENLITSIKQLSGFIGVAGGLISFVLIFVPAEDSRELKFMKNAFSEVNTKLDGITQKLDNIGNMITLESQRAAYIQDASKIIYGYDMLTKNYLTEMAAITSCSTAQDCLRQRLRVSESYQKSFDVRASLFTILTGTTQSTSTFADSLLDLIKTTYKCDIKKVLDFANGVIKLAFKGQQVVLAHLKLTGTNKSISLAVKDWSDMVYNVRKKVDDVKTFCYDNINTYMKEDVEDTKYQIGMATNKEAADNMKANLEDKYPWVFWTAVSYGAYGADKHWGFSTFNNMPISREERKRVIRVITQDKGTYRNQRQELDTALEKIIRDTVFPVNGDKFARLVYETFKNELQKTTVWLKLRALFVLKDYSDLQVAIDNEHALYFYDSELDVCFKNNITDINESCGNNSVRVWASLKSEEEIAGIICTRNCSNEGYCARLPHSSSTYCICHPYFQGDNCQEHDDIILATNVDSMLKVTTHIPKFTDIYFEILDMQDFIGSSLGRVHDSIASLDIKLQSKFDDLNEKLTIQFEWANLITQYSATLHSLTYYLSRFKELNSSHPDYKERSQTLANDILRSDYVEKWVFELNFLFVGRNDPPVLPHKPVLFLLMDKNKEIACSSTYKEGLDNSWRQLVILQNQAYIMWALARSIIKQSSDDIKSKYNMITTEQGSFIRRSTCELSVRRSSNLRCTGGFYLYPKLRLINKCRPNNYIVGSATTSCIKKTSSCNYCNCNPVGSSSSECNDFTGKCHCKDNYFGKTCRDRNCKWTVFGRFSNCSKLCGYGGVQVRSRSHEITQKGNGKLCTGESKDSISCFNGCCDGFFHCTTNKKCIPGNENCNYDNDCGNSEDEIGCTETCNVRYTGWNSHGDGNAVYIDRHRINCGAENNVLKMFKMERKGDNIRFRYTCCLLLNNVCSMRKVTNDYTDDGDGNTVYLDRQYISCGSKGILTQYWLSRNRNFDKWRYNYYCCDMNSKFVTRLDCYTTSTSFTDDGDGKNYYLDRQTVSCSNRHFLQYFHLNRHKDHDHWRYTYRCCRISIE